MFQIVSGFLLHLNLKFKNLFNNKQNSLPLHVKSSRFIIRFYLKRFLNTGDPVKNLKSRRLRGKTKSLETFRRCFHGDKDTHMVIQLTSICSKSTIETLEKRVKHV